jgi:hypothetical protein
MTDLPMSHMNENVPVTPFSKALAKVMVISIVKSEGKKCSIFFVPDREQVMLTPTKHCSTIMYCPGSLLHILMKITFFSRMACLAHSHFLA